MNDIQKGSAGVATGIVGGAVGAGSVIALCMFAPGFVDAVKGAARTAEPLAATASVLTVLSADELRQLTGRAELQGDAVHFDIYNGTNHRISSVEVLVSIGGRFENRRLSATKFGGLAPLSGGTFYANHGDGYVSSYPNKPQFTWRIVSAEVAP